MDDTAGAREPGGECYAPILVRTRTIRRPVEPIAYDCVKLIVVRDGSAILAGDFGQKPITAGDVVLLGANVACGSEPESHIALTVIYLDTDYLLDQIFWVHSNLLHDRLDAGKFAAEIFSERAQVMRLGVDQIDALIPWLDELTALSLDGFSVHAIRMQALWYSILDMVAPFIQSRSSYADPSQRSSAHPMRPPRRRFAPLRSEARQAAALLRKAPAQRWTVHDLAAAVHLSPSQFGRVFVDAFGKTPMAYLSTLRAERLAHLLRETDLPVEQAMREVGWRSRGHAARMFRQALGVTPTRYRQASRQTKSA